MLDEAGLRDVYAVLKEAWSLERPRLDLIRAYMRNQANDIYVPSEADSEYRMLVDQSRFNILPLVTTTVAQGLYVDGYRTASESGLPSDTDSPIWTEVWQRNRMDARQAQIYRPAVTYGASFLTVLPGKPSPVLAPYSPWRCTTLFADDDDEWPKFAMTTPNDYTLAGSRVVTTQARLMGPPLVRIFDEEAVYEIPVDGFGNPDLRSRPVVKGHDLGVCPVVRFRRIDDDGSASFGKIEPLLSLQRQINQTTFSLLMAAQFGAFKQRHVTGMALDKDPVTGEIKQPFNIAVNSLLVSDSPDTKFGEFTETDLSGYLNTRDKAIVFAASTAQIPPHNLLIADGISNIAAETLAALESGHQLDMREYKKAFGEGMEQALRLAGRAIGDEAAWEDIAAEVHWDDTTPRSLGQLVDALGKMAAQLGIPVQELWSKIPGTTEQEIARWRAAAASEDLLNTLEAFANAPVAPGQPVDGQVPVAAGNPVAAGQQPAQQPVPVG